MGKLACESSCIKRCPVTCAGFEAWILPACLPERIPADGDLISFSGSPTIFAPMPKVPSRVFAT